MMTLRDGPAAGSYAVTRAPQYLRAVVDADGKGDVLDQVSDVPHANERVSVYRIVRYDGQVHINRGSKGSGFYVLAEYVHMSEVDGESLRSREAWQDWASAQPEAGHYADAEPQPSTGEPE